MEFLTSSPSRDQIVNFTAGKQTRQRVRYLMNASNAGMITSEERAELEEFHRVERFLYQMKIRARRITPQD
jgi:hypothetical protein